VRPEDEVVRLRREVEQYRVLVANMKQQSEEKYRTLFHTVPDAVMLMDAETQQFLDVNPSTVELYGYTKDEFLALSHSEVAAEPEDSDRIIKETAAGRLGFIPRRLHRKRDGTIFPVEVSACSFDLEGRQVLCGVIRDISARHRTEEALQRSREELRSLAGRLHALLEAERKRIAREVHDELGQALTALKMDLSLLPRTDDEQTRDRLKFMSRIIDSTMSSVKRMVSELRPGPLEDLGLIAAIGWQARQWPSRP